MDTSTTSIEGNARRASLEELPKEELIKKCRNLLTIAQKAKHARDSLAEENAKLKQELSQQSQSLSTHNATEELIQSFTQQKLDLVTSIDRLTHQQNLCEEANLQLQTNLNVAEDKLTALDTANQGYKRQVVRLTEENEQLLTHLDGLESQINELKRIGLEQQQQLLILEENNELLTNKQQQSENNQVDELQKMLAVSLEEIRKLKEENCNLLQVTAEKEAKIINLNDLLSTNELNDSKVQLLQKDEELQSQASVIDDLNTELHKNRALADKLKQDISNTSKRLNANQIESSGINAELQNYNEKLREKLKSYHAKIVKLAGDVKKVKESKDYILDTFKVYNQQVQQWQGQLKGVSIRLHEEMQQNADERNKLHLKIVELEEKLRLSKLDTDTVLRLDEIQEIESVKHENANLHKTVDVMRSQISALELEKSTYQAGMVEIDKFESKTEECCLLQDKLAQSVEVNRQLQVDFDNLQVKQNDLRKDDDNMRKMFEDKVSQLKNQLEKKQNEFELLQKQFEDLKLNNSNFTNDLSNLKEQTSNEVKLLQDSLQNEKQLLLQSKEMFEAEKMTWETQKSHFEAVIEGNSRLISELRKAIERLESDVASSRQLEAKLAEQTSETILQLRQANMSLETRADELQRQLEATQLTGNASTLKSENAELLSEMNVMNQALKERGETISQQQAHCEELVRKIQVYEAQLAKSQESVQQLQEEIQGLRGSLQDCDALSTSTISRCDEANRMKELEGSWEERYGKLRNYALKLKAKAKELQDELHTVEAEMVERGAGHIKTVQSMQGQIDTLQDRLDSHNGDKQHLEQVSKDNQRLLQQVTAQEETIQRMRTQIDGLTQEKVNLDSWKKQVGLKVQALKKELEANALMRKDFEARVQKLQTELTNKDKELVAEKDRHIATKSQLSESNNECKKQSVLNLEMQDYERSIKDMAVKLERKTEQVTKLKNQIDSQKSSVSASKEQHRLADAKCAELETELDACRIEIRAFKKQIAELEIAIGDRECRIDEVRKSLEQTRSENEDLSTQLSRIIADHQKASQLLRDEKDHFRSENVELESRVRHLADALKLRNDELVNVNSEYQSYKVRAQSVLRQNQSRDVGIEEKLKEEAASLRAQLQIYQSEIEDFRLRVQSLEATNQQLQDDKSQLEQSHNDVQLDYLNANAVIEKLNAKNLQTIQEHNETVRSLKLHTETLSQCYRQQISEQEVRHNREIIELQSKYDKNPSHQTDIPSLLIPTSVREEGEGSESVDSNNANVVHPLEKLLGSDQDVEMAAVRKQLNENELRVVHLTALLADTEQDLSKHMQMNKVLKEEIRRQQRSVERERHAENLEYMKNVVFKFLTLNSGDERLRLVPVLNTILKLSPDETSKLNFVAKGGDKSWSTYLPMWSGGAGGSKPQ